MERVQQPVLEPSTKRTPLFGGGEQGPSSVSATRDGLRPQTASNAPYNFSSNKTGQRAADRPARHPPDPPFALDDVGQPRGGSIDLRRNLASRASSPQRVDRRRVHCGLAGSGA